MTTKQIILGSVFEVISLIVVVRIWLKRYHKSRAARLFWSIVLLVPIFGLIAYYFLTEAPDRHPDYMETMNDSIDNSSGPDSGHHSP